MLFSGFKNPFERIRETKKLESIHEYHFVERKNEGRKRDKNSSLRRLEFVPRKANKNAVQEFHLWSSLLIQVRCRAVLHSIQLLLGGHSEVKISILSS